MRTAVAVFAVWLLGLSGAQAATTMTFTEVGNDVVGTLAGTLNLPKAPIPGLQILRNNLAPASGALAAGSGLYSGSYSYAVTGPLSFGTGGSFVPISNTANAHFKLSAGPAPKFTVYGLISPSFVFSGALTFANQSFASLGLLPGSYVYTFSNGETFTINVATVPVPAGIALLAAGLGALGFMGWRKRRAAAAR